MQVFFGFLVGALIGYFMIKKSMEQRLFMILTKTGLFSEEQLGFLMSYYRDYKKICKEVEKKQRDEALRMEANYRLSKERDQNDKAQKL